MANLCENTKTRILRIKKRRCSKCKKDLPFTFFTRNKLGFLKLYNRCKPCVAANYDPIKDALYRQKNRLRIRIAKSLWRLETGRTKKSKYLKQGNK